ncbi:hypothetical protein BALCAV_0202485 [Alkalihalobacillus alcalophilus ATCC 27647 = CGMCC 1.3604]|uniref:Uncharacterized protein n=1 Tax=Alkalihalobacillus alcalophilus ATCC 27647 = CGMCC 1.3604 TaxID=1218173 RepID=A0A094WPS2_ALKAL|nr:hypothetical protein BALCAV_0202485 [Alkalihalobacillus alcalophilus ATCC 27647 = CGMCC 1.3604]
MTGDSCGISDTRETPQQSEEAPGSPAERVGHAADGVYQLLFSRFLANGLRFLFNLAASVRTSRKIGRLYEDKERLQKPPCIFSRFLANGLRFLYKEVL